MKHTKGDWVIVYNKDGSIESIRVKEWGNNDLMGDYRGCIIAHFNESHGNRKHAFEEAEANAKLIAAAPDILEALIRFIKFVDDQKLEYESSMIREAKAAIKKATE